MPATGRGRCCAPARAWSRSSRSGSSTTSSPATCRARSRCCRWRRGRSRARRELAVSRLHPTVSSLAAGFPARMRAAPGFAGVRWDATETVEVTTLDALIAAHGLPRFVKIDVEGAEAEVLAGLGQPVDWLAFEYLPAAPEAADACLARLAGLGAYAFNLVPGEAAAFALDRWLDADAIGARAPPARRRRPRRRRLRAPAGRRRCLTAGPRPSPPWRRSRSSTCFSCFRPIRSRWRCRRFSPCRSSCRRSSSCSSPPPPPWCRRCGPRSSSSPSAWQCSSSPTSAPRRAFRRPFNPVLDGELVAAGLRLLGGSIGWPGALAFAAALVLAIAATAAAAWWATGRLARLAPAWRRPWLAAIALGATALVLTDAAPRPAARPAGIGGDRPAGAGAPARRRAPRAPTSRASAPRPSATRWRTCRRTGSCRRCAAPTSS